MAYGEKFGQLGASFESGPALLPGSLLPLGCSTWLALATRLATV